MHSRPDSLAPAASSLRSRRGFPHSRNRANRADYCRECAHTFFFPGMLGEKRLRSPPHCFKIMMPRSYHPCWLEEKVDRKEEKERLKRDSDKRVRPEVEARME